MYKTSTILNIIGLSLLISSQIWLLIKIKNITQQQVLVNVILDFIGIIAIIVACLVKHKETYNEQNLQNYYGKFDECGDCACSLAGGGSVFMNKKFSENTGAGLGWIN